MECSRDQTLGVVRVVMPWISLRPPPTLMWATRRNISDSAVRSTEHRVPLQVRLDVLVTRLTNAMICMICQCMRKVNVYMHYNFDTKITDYRSNYLSCGKCCSHSLIATNDFPGKHQLEQLVLVPSKIQLPKPFFWCRWIVMQPN